MGQVAAFRKSFPDLYARQGVVSRCRDLNLAEQVRTEFGHRADTELTEHAVDLQCKNFECARHTGFAARGESIQRGAPEHHRVRAERERFHYIRAAPEPTVDHEGHLLADGGCDIRQDFDRCDTSVELPPAVIGEHDAIAPET